MKIILPLITLFITFTIFAKDNDKEALDLPLQEKSWGVYGTYSYFDTWLPSKYGFNISYQKPYVSYEFNYQIASYSFDFIIDDLGKVSDQRIVLQKRNFSFQNSFNFIYGINYTKYQIRLGSSYLDIVSDKFKLLELSSLGITSGIGNRFFIKENFSFGIDWFKIHLPIYQINQKSSILDETQSDSDKKEIKKLLSIMSKVPTFSILYLEFGYLF